MEPFALVGTGHTLTFTLAAWGIIVVLLMLLPKTQLAPGSADVHARDASRGGSVSTRRALDLPKKSDDVREMGKVTAIRVGWN